MTPSGEGVLTPDLVWSLFETVDNTLAARRRPVGLLVVGGSAMLLRWDPGRLTRDVDVVEPLPDTVRDAAAGAAAPYGLSPLWLNDAAMVARPIGLEPDDPLVVYPGKSLTVSVAGPRYVLAMKVFAGRFTDRRDLPWLFAAAGVDSLAAVYALHNEAYRGAPLHAEADRGLREAWADYAEPRGLPVGLGGGGCTSAPDRCLRNPEWPGCPGRAGRLPAPKPSSRRLG